MGLKRTGKIKKVDTSSKILERESKFGTGKGLPTNSVRFIRLSGYYTRFNAFKVTKLDANTYCFSFNFSSIYFAAAARTVSIPA